MLILRQVRTVMSDCIKLVMMVMEVAMVTVRVEEIMLVEVTVVAIAEGLGSRQLSLVIWKMFLPHSNSYNQGPFCGLTAHPETSIMARS